jgi:hypothetical protein
VDSTRDRHPEDDLCAIWKHAEHARLRARLGRIDDLHHTHTLAIGRIVRAATHVWGLSERDVCDKGG